MRYLREKEKDPSWTPPTTEDDPKGQEDSISEDIEPVEENSSEEKATVSKSFADRLPNLKKYRNRRLIGRLSLIVGILLVPLIIAVYYVSPLSKLESIKVTGNQSVAADAIVDQSKVKLHEEIWAQYFHREQTESLLKKTFPQIKTATVSIKPLNHFVIRVSEYQKVALLLKDSKYSPVLENGAVLGEASEQADKGLPVLEGFEAGSKITRTLAAYQKLSSEIREGISQIKYAPRENNDELLNIFMNDGNQVIVNISNLASQMQYYPQIAKDLEEKSVIDMEVGIFTYSNTEHQEEPTSETQDSETNN